MTVVMPEEFVQVIRARSRYVSRQPYAVISTPLQRNGPIVNKLDTYTFIKYY